MELRNRKIILYFKDALQTGNLCGNGFHHNTQHMVDGHTTQITEGERIEGHLIAARPTD